MASVDSVHHTSSAPPPPSTVTAASSMINSDNQNSNVPTINSTIPTINPIIQSSLNPNAPDFSVRNTASFIPNQAHQQNGPMIRGMHQHPSLPSQSRSMAFQDVNQFQMQMRAAILAAGASLQMQTFQAQAAHAAQAAQAAQNQARFQCGPIVMPNVHQQTAGPMGAPDFNPPSAETLRLLQSAITANAAMHQTTPQNMQQFNMMQNVTSMRQHHQPHLRPHQPPSSSHQSSQQRISHSTAQQANISSSSKENDASTIDLVEERKLPRPIGTERAQKKNPIYGISGATVTIANSAMETLPASLWPCNEVAVEGGDWLPPGTGAGHENVQGVLHNNYLMNRNYISINESSSEPAEHEFAVNYPYFSFDM